MILQVLETANTIGQLAPTALLGLIIAALVYDRKGLVEKLDSLHAANDELQKSMVTKAEVVTEKLVSALHATERQFEKVAEAQERVIEGQALMNQLLTKILEKR